MLDVGWKTVDGGFRIANGKAVTQWERVLRSLV
jgi:hypothetical protein